MTHPITSKRIAERFNLSNRSEFIRLSAGGMLSNVTVCTDRGRVERISEPAARLVILQGKNVYADVHQTESDYHAERFFQAESLHQ